MASLVDLLKWKKSVSLKDAKEKEVATVWVRVLGDFDIQQAYKISRAASNKKRLALRNPETVDYLDEVLPVEEFSREDKCEIIRTARRTTFTSEALVKVEREELPKIEEVAKEPDAASLEDQEELDKLIDKQNAEYSKALEEFVEDRIGVLNKELEAKTDEELTTLAVQEISNVIPYSIFMDELNNQKLFRGTYQDEGCKERVFKDIEEVYNLHPLIKTQLIAAFSDLEMTPDEVKN